MPSSRPVLDVPAAWRALRRLDAQRGGVLHRPDVVSAGVPRWLLRGELRAGRWQRGGRQTLVTHNGALSPAQRRAVAVLEVGPRAALDGTAALQQAGIEVADDGRVHVIAPKGSTPKHPPGTCVHESRRFREDDVALLGGVRTVEPATAAVHAALWARSDREAQLLVLLVVQQRRSTPLQVQEAVERVHRHPRRALLRRVATDLELGVRSLGERDLAKALRRRGLPAPDRQVLRLRPSGRQYLDCRWDRFRLAMEVDGVQHDDPDARVRDALRDLDLQTDGDAVVRVPLVALRLAEDEVLDRLEALLRARGWASAA